MNHKELKITLDKFNDPEKITSYKIINDHTKNVLAKGYYFFILGFRLGFHIDSDQCKLTQQKNIVIFE